MIKLNHLIILLVLLLFFSCQKVIIDAPPNNTPPVAEEAAAISFAVIGDYGDDGDPELAVSELVHSWDSDFIITLGDNNYTYGDLSTIKANISQYYGDYIYNPDAPQDYRCNGDAAQEKKNRFFPTLGNHDQDGDSGYLPYLLYFSLPGEEIYYDFEWGPVHFFTINSGADTDHNCCDSEQAKWMKERLDKSTKPFKVVFFHHPPYSSSKHGNKTSMQWPFEEWGANAVLSGHAHTYERIHKKENPDFPYIVNGLGGRHRYDCNDNPLNEANFDSYCFDSDFGAMKCTATSEELILRFYTVNDPELIVDEFIIRK